MCTCALQCVQYKPLKFRGFLSIFAPKSTKTYQPLVLIAKVSRADFLATDRSNLSDTKKSLNLVSESSGWIQFRSNILFNNESAGAVINVGAAPEPEP